MIPQHIAPKLSALDLQIIRSVPPGGNWKNIPVSVPSARLEQIRRSFAAGKGSRSTYYGRLRPGAPSYTISTYFTRPGNGCHIHYDQDRVLTYREAARLQSFPDSFVFEGSLGSVANQIGNAVPPLMAYQAAVALGERGSFVDLFAGAGGLSLGFKWAGWSPIVGTDVDGTFLRSYARNIHPNVVYGDIRHRSTVLTLLAEVAARRATAKDGPLWVLGGPPCQGFSTAGNRRSPDDERNQLFLNYRDFIKAVSPDGFIFENVTGLLNMEAGAFFQRILESLQGVMDRVVVWRMAAEEYGVPQRRHRVFIVGTRSTHTPVDAPMPIGKSSTDASARWITVEDAISDLPPLSPGEDGQQLPYHLGPTTQYQMLARGITDPPDYLHRAAAAASESDRLVVPGLRWVPLA